jgi:hypothetical protein
MFQDAAGGKSGSSETPLGPFDRGRAVKHLDSTAANFEPIKS